MNNEIAKTSHRKDPSQFQPNGYRIYPLHSAVIHCDGSANAVLDPIEWLTVKMDVTALDIVSFRSDQTIEMLFLSYKYRKGILNPLIPNKIENSRAMMSFPNLLTIAF